MSIDLQENPTTEKKKSDNFQNSLSLRLNQFMRVLKKYIYFVQIRQRITSTGFRSSN